ncbi:hypothetical protein D3C75_1049320 [compost metagenome]
MLAVDVGFIIIEEIKHLLHGVEEFGELGALHPFVSRWRLNDLEGRSVSTLNGLNESFDQDRGLRLGHAGAGGRVE